MRADAAGGMPHDPDRSRGARPQSHLRHATSEVNRGLLERPVKRSPLLGILASFEEPCSCLVLGRAIGQGRFARILLASRLDAAPDWLGGTAALRCAAFMRAVSRCRPDRTPVEFGGIAIDVMRDGKRVRGWAQLDRLGLSGWSG